MSVKDKVALVSGASRGIGKAIALQLAQQGAKVVGTATSEQGAESISRYLNDGGLSGIGMVLNVTEMDSVNTAVEACQSQFGDPQILVNNAAITRDNLLMRMKEEEWDRVIDTNLNSIFRMTKLCLRPMIKARWGRIISISSVVGVMGNPGQTNYAAAKAGVIGFSKSLAYEVASRGITVNVIAPGFIATDMTDVLTDEQKASILKNVPMQRLGLPTDIANAVNYLASDEAAYITGHTLHINGGMYMG